jgi:TPR repeat protein
MAMLIKRGRSLLSVGDISSAQLLFRRAAEAGSAEAAVALASTYDPHYLAEHHVVGVSGDEEKARVWYQRALDLGSPEADHLLAQLSAR